MPISCFCVFVVFDLLYCACGTPVEDIIIRKCVFFNQRFLTEPDFCVSYDLCNMFFLRQSDVRIAAGQSSE